MIAPNFVQEILWSILKMHDTFSGVTSFENSRAIGAILISIGVHYHLLYIMAKDEYFELKVVISISLLLLLPTMIYLAL